MQPCCAAWLPRLREHGRYLSVAGSLSDVLVRTSGTPRSMGGPARERPQDLLELVRLADAGAYQAVIDGIYPFNQLPAAQAGQCDRVELRARCWRCRDGESQRRAALCVVSLAC